MGLLKDSMERTTGRLSDGGRPAPIPRHTHTFEVPAGNAAPGVFVDAEGNEVGFWLTLQSLTQAQEMKIINAGMPSGRKKKATANFAQKLVENTMHLFHEQLPAVLGGDDDGEELQRSDREWLWNALDQRGRNLVSQEYDTLTEPTGDASPEPDPNG
jgi:hypothetical protein